MISNKIRQQVFKEPQGKKLRASRRQSYTALFLMALPAILLLFAFNYMPMVGLVIPFKNMDYSKGIFGSDWCGLKNFEFFFRSNDAWRVTRNTVLMNIAMIIVGRIVAIALALGLYELRKGQIKVYQTCMFMPHFVSWVVVSYIVYAFLAPGSGVVPMLISKFGGEQISFYNEPKYWPFILLLASVWKGVGYNTLLYYASLMSMDSTYYEAAAIDGATRWQRTRYITLPHLKTIVILTLLLSIGQLFSGDFGMYYFLTRNSGALYETTDIINTYVYRALRVSGDIGMSSAASLFQSVLGFITLFISNLLVRKVDPDSALF